MMIILRKWLMDKHRNTGERVSAEDVKFSLDRARDKSLCLTIIPIMHKPYK